MRRMVRRILVVMLFVAALAAGAHAASPQFPERIPLPNGFQPEGIAIAPGGTFYVGSIPTGAIYRGSVKTGKGSILVRGGNGRAAIGVEYDQRTKRLFVAGGPTGSAFVYDARTGRELRRYRLTSSETFVNDVVVTRSAAWFTDSVNQVLYRIGIGPKGTLAAQAQTVPITGDLVYQDGFNANGIDATPDGRTLVVVQSNTGRLFRVNAVGLSTGIDTGTETFPNGDGLLLDGRTLYVVQNRLNVVAVVALAPDLASGRLVTRLTDPDFAVPTTIDDFGRRLYAVNARFGTTPSRDTPYWLAQLRKPTGR
jgi:sugar lactone lactonase YvrE